MRTAIFTGILSIFVLAQAGDAMAWVGHADIMGIYTSGPWMTTTEIVKNDTSCNTQKLAYNDATGFPVTDAADIEHTWAKVKWTPNPYPIQNQKWSIPFNSRGKLTWKVCTNYPCDMISNNGNTYYYSTVDYDTHGVLNVSGCANKSFLKMEYNVYRYNFIEIFKSSQIRFYG